ncbi:MAG TPA: iron-containing alcohol dehydrogenase [Stellaceae bacterium]|nr:iron-containing alcohol dehydrogenase [Stellaceae bacterium]
MALISYMSRIQFDFGALRLLPGELALLGVKRPLLVTDPGVRSVGLVERALDGLDGARPSVFEETPSNPTEAAAEAALALYRGNACDGVVALGGGSAIDLSKAVALLATHPGSLSDYGVRGGGSARIGEIAPVLAIPTTAGTGAEVGRAATLTLKSGRKIACVSLKLIPKAAICDPELTLSLPPMMTAATGMDALSHGIESYLSTSVNPPAAAIALDCVERAGRWIEYAVSHGDDREARWQMLMAALEGGLTFQKSLGAVHAAGHPLGALGYHHGTLNAILLPPVLRFNASAVPEKIARLKAVLGLAPSQDLADWIEHLTGRIGLPTRLSELGLDPALIPELAEEASHEHLSETNPRPATAADYRRILDAAFR